MKLLPRFVAVAAAGPSGRAPRLVITHAAQHTA